MPSRRDAVLRHSRYYVSVLGSIDAQYASGDATLTVLSRLDAEWLNIRSAQSSAAEWPADRDLGALIASIPDSGAYVLSLRQPPAEREAWLNAGLAAARQRRDRPLQISHLLNLGLCKLDQGSPRAAAAFFRRALKMARTDGRKVDEARALGNLGSAILQVGNLEAALEMHRQALRIDRDEGDKRGEAADLGSMGTSKRAWASPIWRSRSSDGRSNSVQSWASCGGAAIAWARSATPTAASASTTWP